jgi:hypothetical protein
MASIVAESYDATDGLLRADDDNDAAAAPDSIAVAFVCFPRKKQGHTVPREKTTEATRSFQSLFFSFPIFSRADGEDRFHGLGACDGRPIGPCGCEVHGGRRCDR